MYINMYMLYIVFYVSLIASFYLDMITMESSLVGQHMFSVALGTYTALVFSLDQVSPSRE